MIKPVKILKSLDLVTPEAICRDVHCDPHAANMLVRLDKKAKPQLVLLDHGLYKQLSEELRLEYAGLWQALIFGNEKVLMVFRLRSFE